MPGLDDMSLDDLQRLRAQRLASDTADKYGLNPDTFSRQLKQESGFNQNARSPAGAIGVGQLMPGTARELGVDPNDMAQNIDGAGRYMRQNLDRFGGDERLALAAYHAGPGDAQAALNNPAGNPKTNAYVNAITGAPGGSGVDLDGMSLEQLKALRAKVAPPVPTKPRPLPAALRALDGQTPPQVLPDVAKAGATGLGQGVVAPLGIRGDMANLTTLGVQGVGKLLGKMGATEGGQLLSDLAGALNKAPGHIGPMVNPFRGVSSGDINQKLGLTYEAQTLPGKVAQKVGQFAPAALAPGSIPQRVAAVGLPAAGAVGGREVVKAGGGGEGAQAVGEFVGSLAGGLGAAAKAPKLPMKAPAPSLDELQTAKTAAYKAVETSGIKYTPKAVDALVDGISSDLASVKLSASRHPKAADMLEEIKALKGKPMTLTELDQLRQVIRRDVANAKDDGEAFMGRRMIAKVDKFIETVGAGNTEIKAARDLNTRVRKVESVQDAQDRAANRAGGSGAGSNIDNATRQELRRVLENTPNLTPAETKALQSIVRGDKVQNAARLVGKLSPTNGIVSMGVHGLLAKATGGASLPFSLGAKALADQMTATKVQKLVDLMARGGSGAPAAKAQLQQIAKTNPALLSDNAKRMLAIGGLSIAAGAPAVPAAAQRQQSRR